MDSLIAASARALAAGDPLGCLQHVALRDDPPALALRGTAMAQLGDYVKARSLLRRAALRFGNQDAMARARCVVAEGEVALAMRDLGNPRRTLDAALATLDARGDRANALHARLIVARRLLLLGRLGDAAQALAVLDASGLPAALSAVAALCAAELALRSLQTAPALAALARASDAARRAAIPALLAEVLDMEAVLDRPAARRMSLGSAELLRLADVEALLASDALVVDACRHCLQRGSTRLSLARRPILFMLVRALAQAWPGDVGREALIDHAFRTRLPDDTHRARLRVEIGRLRALVKPVADIEATARGFVLRPHGGADVVVIAPPLDGPQASLLALLSDGVAWSTSALALALGDSQRTVQRALADLEAAGQARAIGQARARRWLAAPLAPFAPLLLLPASLQPA